MASTTELKCWPACLRAIDWSHDGVIALASGAQVELLFPNTRSQDEQQDRLQWQHFALQVPWFRDEELPKREPAPLKTFSVGEEISTSYPAEIAWSPPGLAKHRGCALAVLTSNLVLSIWTSEGKLQDPASWDRRLIVNQALAGLCTPDPMQEQSKSASERDEKLRLRKRVRTFTWAPSAPIDGAVSIIGTQLSWGKHILAISNDDKQVILIQVSSPTSTLGVEEAWNAEILSIFSTQSDIENPSQLPPVFDDLVNHQNHFSTLAWSPWIRDGATHLSVLAYGTNRDVRARVVSICQDKISLGPEAIYPEAEVRYAGPLAWSPGYCNGTLLLALFTLTSINFLSISAKNASVMNSRTYKMDRYYDSISGIAWDVLNDTTHRLHFAPQTMTTRCSTVVLEISPTAITDVSTQDWPYWREQISGSQGHFSANHDLKGHANAKVWGLSASPLGDSIVACHTVHPTDMVEYGTPNDRLTNVTITRMRGQGSILDFPISAVSAESILNTARRWMESKVESSESLPAVKAEIHRKLISAYGPHQLSPPNSDQFQRMHESNDINIIRALKQIAFLNSDTLNDRYEVLASRICTPSVPTDIPKILIAFRLAQAIQGLPRQLYAAHKFSIATLKAHRQLIRLSQSVLDATPNDDATRLIYDLGPDIEKCIFCDEKIPFTDPFSASCSNGHHFLRCGLSLLAIQAPNITKYCGLCKTPFFSEAYIMNECAVTSDQSLSSINPHDPSGSDGMELPHDQASEDTHNEPRPVGRADHTIPFSLARVLFLACDVCIYCGGKFVD